ncbi:hypothetical protein WA1_26050 [Scytonema hofmannii PCC 7110]|uniref:Uncharacterized protein n=2 Tax=Scytonema hofmannii TaxID=34078 RepID=A0A139X7G5_9CYAN|nr:hypothetical protein WA1_26050 [Scytonema hofmannii PCC 7110]
MVIGSNVLTVQRVSSYCLKQNAEVFPYYGIPRDEEVTLFTPHVLVLCLPLDRGLACESILLPYILWSEQPMNDGLPSVTTPTELYVRLQEVLQGLN